MSRELGRVAPISGEVRAAGTAWEAEMQRALLDDGQARPGDAALLDRLCQNVGLDLRPAPFSEPAPSTAGFSSSRWWRPLIGFAPAAAVLLLTVGAFALGAAASELIHRSAPAPRAPSVTLSPPRGLAISKGARPSISSEPLPPTTPLAPSLRSLRPAVQDDPEQLFASAKRAQRAGDTALAISRFQRLQGLFPQSAAAQVSRLVLGSLWMQRGDPTRALEQYQRYLAAGGVLSEEALSDEAHAFRALGRASDEARAWRTLLSRYPRSFYAERARQRLSALPGSP